MSFDKYIERIKRIDKMIQLEATGSPKALSIKIGISERMVYEYINKMKSLGAPITYNESKSTYLYTEPVVFECIFKKI